jgi:hypothetical protein
LGEWGCFMKKYIISFAIISSFIFFQTAIAEENKGGTSEKAEVTSKHVEKVRIPEVFGTRQIKDWQVIDDKTIIIDTYSYGKYKATFTQPCMGIRSTETIGFMTRGPYALDKYTTIFLGDGERCFIQELVPYTEKDGAKDKTKK